MTLSTISTKILIALYILRWKITLIWIANLKVRCKTCYSSLPWSNYYFGCQRSHRKKRKKLLHKIDFSCFNYLCFRKVNDTLLWRWIQKYNGIHNVYTKSIVRWIKFHYKRTHNIRTCEEQYDFYLYGITLNEIK